MHPFKELKPEAIWQYFYEITQIPRPSKKEEKIIAYLESFAQQFNLDFSQDKAGNVLIKKAATIDKVDAPKVILQSHMDMVCEKNSDTEFDFEKEPLKVYVKDGWVSAEGTTLGGDDGIGMAAELALLASEDLSHPALECLFTVDEETGLTGAFALEKGFLSADILINLDSEDDAEVYVGCAGGVDTLVNFEYHIDAVPHNYEAVKLSVSGLSGGHSGGDIHLNRANANKLLAQFIAQEAAQYDVRLADIKGGNLRNAIPREAYATLLIPATQEMDLMQHLKAFQDAMATQYKDTDPHLSLQTEAVDMPANVIDTNTQMRLINAINQCPNGVIGMSKSIEGLVETSTNLASVTLKAANSDKKGIIEVVTSQRSSSEEAKKDIAKQVRSTFENAGAEVKHSDGYPGWSPNLKSQVLKVAQEAFQALHQEDPEIKAIHAGLECGLFLEKYPELDMISIGPTIKDAHSPDERMEIKAVERFWDWLVEILKNI